MNNPENKAMSNYELSSNEYLKSLDLVKESDSKASYKNIQYARQKQMQNARKKREIDFNANNYDVEELAAIVGFKTIPLNKGIITRKILELKRKFIGQQKYQTFFEDTQTRLIENLNLYNKQTWIESYEKEDDLASKVLRNQFLEKTKEEVEGKMNQLINLEKDIIGVAQKPISETYATKNAVQGKLNGMLITEIKRVINFDSHYRQILDSSSVNCENLIYDTNQQNRLYTSTNYVVNLTQPLTNVIDITLGDLEIPTSWYVFSSDYGTTRFNIEFMDHRTQITIENGNYSQALLATEINKKLMEKQSFIGHYSSAGTYITTPSLYDDANYPPFPLIEFKYESHNNKMAIHNYDPSGSIATITWYIPTTNEDACSSLSQQTAPSPGGKIDYNLGWLLGYRTTDIKIHPYKYDGLATHKSNNGAVSGYSQTPPGNAYIPSPMLSNNNGQEIWQGKTIPKSLVNIKGSQYFILTLDDYNNNKANKDLISTVDQVDRDFRQSGYINSQTMNSKYGLGKYEDGYYGVQGYECVDVADSTNNERACSTNDLNTDLSSNLTKAQLYTANQISMARNQVPVNRYKSPNSTDLFARFPVNINPLDWNNSIIYNNPDKELTKRKYFGPVKLSKFKVRLLNDKGYEVDLNDRDWSFSVIVTSLYQY